MLNYFGIKPLVSRDKYTPVCKDVTKIIKF